MAEKILNTRIQLKYDTLANWNASTFKLKAGELAIVTLGEVKDGSVAGDVNQHPVLFKVGTGEHTFAQLPFASALAADVYSWAKASDVVLTGKTIQFKNGDNVVKSIELKYLEKSEVDTLISKALESYSTTTEMNAAIKVETDRAKEVEGGLNTRIQSLETAIGENGSVATQIQTAIEGLDSNASQAAGDDGLALSITLADGKVTSITGSIAAETYDAYGAAQAAQTAAEAKVTALENGAVRTNANAIAAINHETTGILAQAKGYANGLNSAMDGRMQVVEGKAHEHTNKTVLDGITEAKVNAWDAAEQNAKKYADDIKKSILGEGISETFDTLVEIQNWIEGDGVNATELTQAIADEAKLRSEEDAKLQGQINALGIVDGKVESAKNADIANSLTDNAKAEVKAVKVDNATNADNADKLGGVVASNYALKTDAQDYADQAEENAIESAKTYTDGRETAITTAYKAYTDQAELDAIASAKTYTDNREIEIKKYADQAEADAKAYADGLAKNYATAAQGAKADSALQEVEVGSGLKVSAKAENKQTIEIDDSVVFVFDCGSATRNI